MKMDQFKIQKRNGGHTHNCLNFTQRRDPKYYPELVFGNETRFNKG